VVCGGREGVRGGEEEEVCGVDEGNGEGGEGEGGGEEGGGWGGGVDGFAVEVFGTVAWGVLVFIFLYMKLEGWRGLRT
jgi:hypothetical protein